MCCTLYVSRVKSSGAHGGTYPQFQRENRHKSRTNLSVLADRVPCHFRGRLREVSKINFSHTTLAFYWSTGAARRRSRLRADASREVESGRVRPTTSQSAWAANGEKERKREKEEKGKFNGSTFKFSRMSSSVTLPHIAHRRTRFVSNVLLYRDDEVAALFFPTLPLYVTIDSSGREDSEGCPSRMEEPSRERPTTIENAYALQRGCAKEEHFACNSRGD